MKSPKKDEAKPPSFHDYIDRFTVGSLVVAALGIVAVVVIRRRRS
jgi:hypothetical protein